MGIATRTQGPFPYKGPDAHNLPEVGTACIKFPIVRLYCFLEGLRGEESYVLVCDLHRETVVIANMDRL